MAFAGLPKTDETMIAIKNAKDAVRVIVDLIGPFHKLMIYLCVCSIERFNVVALPKTGKLLPL